MNQAQSLNQVAIAIIGMAVRFPEANTTAKFWQNLCSRKESIYFFSEDELLAQGIPPAILHQPNYVKAKGKLANIDLFDAGFFGFSARDTQLLDPQHRMFLECAWEALEDAGYTPDNYQGAIGVYGGAGINTYFYDNLKPNLQMETMGDEFQVMLLNDRGFIPTWVSYKLNLTGPSISIQTACSTSLVAVHLASQSLLSGECDIALAGGVTIRLPQESGYLCQEGMIASPDGHCRAFDAQAKGTVAANGAGIVVLKCLEDALADGDYIYAVIRGSAINNDGFLKVGYTAPSVEGQAAVISEAQAIAEVDPETITYIETHGTGTPLGDPIEIAALTQAFRKKTAKTGFCAIGSVKTNLGHLDTAAGIAGLIKTALALKYHKIPPSLNFQQPNPKIDFANSPFFVNTTLKDWESQDHPRRAGVSSFGIGGTNAHLVLEEAPAKTFTDGGRPWQLLPLSAKTSSALEKMRENLAQYLDEHPSIDLADVAYTLSLGRKAFNHRQVVIGQTLQEIKTRLTESSSLLTGSRRANDPAVIFMFSGQGSQYINMAKELYQIEPTFSRHIDHCSEFLKPLLGIDPRELVFPEEKHSFRGAEQLKETRLTQPVLFMLEYALAQLWMQWGIIPQAMIGHSIGEYVAACLAGVFSLEDGLSLVVDRGRMMQQLPQGAMLSITLPIEDLYPLLNPQLDLALINGPSLGVVSGSIAAIQNLENQLTQQEIACRRLQTSHAFHSQMMEPILAEFKESVARISLNSPTIPYLSNVTGNWITPQEASDPQYWATHLRSTVQFNQGLETLLSNPEHILLEVGPGNTLSTLARRHPHRHSEQFILNSTRHPQESQSDLQFLLTTLGQLWLAGVQVNWSEFYGDQQRYRVPLPTYPFERQRYWIEAPKPSHESTQTSLTENLAGLASIQFMEQPLEDTLREWLDSEQGNIAIYEELSHKIEDFIRSITVKTLIDLGWNPNDKSRLSWQDLIKTLKIHSKHEYYLSFLLDFLQKDHTIIKDDSGVQWGEEITIPNLQGEFEQLIRQYSFADKILNPIYQLGTNLDQILTGQLNALEWLFPQGSIEQAKELYQAYPTEKIMNRLIAKATEMVIEKLPQGQKIKIVELGAGTGATTAYILPHLPPERTEYIFTDVSRFFLTQAQEQFSNYPFVHYQLFNIESSPQEQNLSEHQFDLILAINVLHVSQNLSQTLKDLLKLLTPQGVLLALEGTESNPVANFLFGAIEQWTQTSDSQQDFSSPALSKEQWQDILSKSGFGEVMIIPKTENPEKWLQTLLIAKKNPKSSEKYPLNSDEPFSPTQELPVSIRTKGSSYVAPRSPVEETLAEIWQKVLGIQPISIDDNFLELGGDSLIATQVNSWVQKTWQVQLSWETWFKTPTIAELAKQIELMRWAKTESISTDNNTDVEIEEGEI